MRSPLSTTSTNISNVRLDSFLLLITSSADGKGGRDFVVMDAETIVRDSVQHGLKVACANGLHYLSNSSWLRRKRPNRRCRRQQARGSRPD
jgi:hypothetical protein